ncbi:MAG: hypothetical protein IJE89_03615 [Bacilli bacterium]|nr:hypothetical protein [Bacilli bacterium]
MEDKLMGLIYDYSQQNKIADPEFIYKVVDLLVNYMNINEYVRDVKVGDDAVANIFSQASYDVYEKTLGVGQSSLKYELHRQNKKVKDYLNDFERTIFQNVLVVQTILHELEHAFQQKKIDLSELRQFEDSFDKRVEMELLKFAKKNIEKESFYTHDFIPDERFAESDSWNKLYGILSFLNDKGKNLLDYCKSRKIEAEISGYDEEKTPTSTYIEFHKDEEILYKPIFSDLLLAQYYCPDYKIRARLGLPLSVYEYNQLYDQIKEHFRSQ